MKNTIYGALLILISTQIHAQTKVFKEVSEDISSQLAPIIQDGKLVGYLFFTTLEKSSADSFNYKLSIMDENLNDIGTVNFKQEHLDLKEVAFEQDILCLAYIKSNFVGKEFRNGKEFRKETSNAKTSLFAQFVDLNGKIVGTNTTAMDVKPESDYVYGGYYRTKLYGNGRLKHPLELKNITGKGFACFYGDDSRNNLLVFSTAGKKIWQNPIREDATDFVMLTSGTEIDLLVKKADDWKEGGFEILSYNSSDSSTYPKFILKDKKGNSLKVLAFENDPATGKPYVSGMIIDAKNGNRFVTGNNLRHGPYDGVFTINLDGHSKKDIKASFSYWADGSQSFVDSHGLFLEPNLYANVERSFKDFNGNTYFAACGVKRRFRWGGLAWGVALSPLVLPPFLYLGGGLHRYAFKDVLLLRQDAAGKLSLATTVAEETGQYQFCAYPLYMVDPRSYYTVSNPDTKSDYLIINSEKNIDVYNVSQNKMARSIPHKDGNTTINLFPAKEGYVMVYEYNKKERTTRLSIEAL